MTYDLGGDLRTQRPWCASLALILLCLAVGSGPAAQAQYEEHPKRRVIRTQKADYPEVLRNKGIGGTVRLTALVLANGTVANVHILGGNPILAASAVNAVMKWKYAAGTTPSNELITFDFNPH